MSHCKLLDCTLRDGAYLTDKYFGDNVISGCIEGLVKAKIDYIEIGFLQNEGFGKGKTVYKNSADAMRFLPKDKQGCEFTVLADYSRYNVSNLDERTDGGVDAIRECFFKNERFDAIEACRSIKEKGYKLFVQLVDILGYSDKELIEFLELINEVEPYCFSIVDTFGSMYPEDLHRIFELIDHNLNPECHIGFHSHNNMQLSNSLSQEFIRMSFGKRNVVVDGTVSGMGRGAGNTPTELIAQYMVSKYSASYDIDALLDVIDTYMDSIRSKCDWGYSTEYFVAGVYSSHVNNIAYLLKKNSIRSKDIRYILNRIGKNVRKRYDYDLLEKTYMDMLKSKIDDTGAREKVKTIIGTRPVLVIAPGKSAITHIERIEHVIKKQNPVIISVNFIHETIQADFLYVSNRKRHASLKQGDGYGSIKKIMTSNFPESEYDKMTFVISFTSLIKCGWETMDNSTIMLLRLLNSISVKEVMIAGFDGYSKEGNASNFLYSDMEMESIVKNATHINREISEMLIDFDKTQRNSDMNVAFITPSRFETCLKTRKEG